MCVCMYVYSMYSENRQEFTRYAHQKAASDYILQGHVGSAMWMKGNEH